QRAAAFEQAVAQDRHGVGEGRKGQVAVERLAEQRHVPARWWQVDVAAGAGARGPLARPEQPEIEFAPPALAACLHQQARRDVPGARLELVIQPVTNWM